MNSNVLTKESVVVDESTVQCQACLALSSKDNKFCHNCGGEYSSQDRLFEVIRAKDGETPQHWRFVIQKDEEGARSKAIHFHGHMLGAKGESGYYLDLRPCEPIIVVKKRLLSENTELEKAIRELQLKISGNQALLAEL